MAAGGIAFDEVRPDPTSARRCGDYPPAPAARRGAPALAPLGAGPTQVTPATTEAQIPAGGASPRTLAQRRPVALP